MKAAQKVDDSAGPLAVPKAVMRVALRALQMVERWELKKAGN